MLYWQLHLVLWQCGLGAIWQGVWDCYIPCHGFAMHARYQCGAIQTLAILLQQINGSLTAAIWARLIAMHRMSFIW